MFQNSYNASSQKYVYIQGASVFWGRLHEFRKKCISHDERNALFEIKLGQLLLRILLSHLFSELNVSINGCLDMELEALTFMNQMIFINLGHCHVYGRLYDVIKTLTDLSLDLVPYIVVQLMQVCWARRPCIWKNMVMEIVMHLCLLVLKLYDGTESCWKM